MPMQALSTYREYAPEVMQARAREMAQELARRRTVREFSTRAVPDGIVEDAVAAAGSAPSGANQQPWRFVVIRDPVLRARLRDAAEAEERAFYKQRAPDEWLRALAPLGTDAEKPFLQHAPILIAVFYERFGVAPDGGKIKHYYPHESVGIACGFLIATLHHAGLATLTHTPSPMGFLNELLARPKNEMPYLLLVAGYPSDDCMVPAITRKSFEEICSVL